MPLVMVPGRMKEFLQWVRDVTKSAELRFGSRASVSRRTVLSPHHARGKNWTRRNRTRTSRMNSRMRRLKNG